MSESSNNPFKSIWPREAEFMNENLKSDQLIN